MDKGGQPAKIGTVPPQATSWCAPVMSQRGSQLAAARTKQLSQKERPQALSCPSHASAALDEPLAPGTACANIKPGHFGAPSELSIWPLRCSRMVQEADCWGCWYGWPRQPTDASLLPRWSQGCPASCGSFSHMPEPAMLEKHNLQAPHDVDQKDQKDNGWEPSHLHTSYCAEWARPPQSPGSANPWAMQGDYMHAICRVTPWGKRCQVPFKLGASAVFPWTVARRSNFLSGDDLRDGKIILLNLDFFLRAGSAGSGGRPSCALLVGLALAELPPPSPGISNFLSLHSPHHGTKVPAWALLLAPRGRMRNQRRRLLQSQPKPRLPKHPLQPLTGLIGLAPHSGAPFFMSADILFRPPFCCCALLQRLGDLEAGCQLSLRYWGCPDHSGLCCKTLSTLALAYSSASW